MWSVRSPVRGLQTIQARRTRQSHCHLVVVHTVMAYLAPNNTHTNSGTLNFTADAQSDDYRVTLEQRASVGQTTRLLSFCETLVLRCHERSSDFLLEIYTQHTSALQVRHCVLRSRMPLTFSFNVSRLTHTGTLSKLGHISSNSSWRPLRQCRSHTPQTM